MNIRLHGQISGIVQGVGFRPFVLRLARAQQVGGFIRNQAGTVEIEVEGRSTAVNQFTQQLVMAAPINAVVSKIDWDERAPLGQTEFRIEDSRNQSDVASVIPGDLAVCNDCMTEAKTREQRRFEYGFGSCTNCGPRFSIAVQPPWDRAATAMKQFPMCADCQVEYQTVSDRRYHAQTNCCPFCGPSPTLFDPTTAAPIAIGGNAMSRAATALQNGFIVALKGVGGFQLLVRADDGQAVTRLRTRKRRPSKPMAVLVSGIDDAREIAVMHAAEQRALCHSSAPIVLCAKRPGTTIADPVTAGMHRIGVMLPPTPLHALLLHAVKAPLVATSGNLHDEPICITNEQAMRRLADVSDLVLGHDRDIVRRCDDSVVDIVNGRTRTLRMGRGLAPHTIEIEGLRHEQVILALGGHLKAAPALLANGKVTLWPHVGNLNTAPARDAMNDAVIDLQRFFATRAQSIVCDQHPDYATTIWAENDGRPIVRVQHHHAHVAACLAESGVSDALGFAWDGFGYGIVDALSPLPSQQDHLDRAQLWGGELLQVTTQGSHRVGTWRPFPLPGGDAAARNGRRALAGICLDAGIHVPEAQRYAPVIHLAPKTTSVGRMFDAVAALVGVCEKSSFEGEAAMRLEALAAPGAEPYAIDTDAPVLDWRPMFREMVSQRDQPEQVASRFHATLAEAIAHVAHQRRAHCVALTGGCFHNQVLLEAAQYHLASRGIDVITPITVPPGDGGLALGQAWVAAHQHHNTAQHESETTRCA